MTALFPVSFIHPPSGRRGAARAAVLVWALLALPGAAMADVVTDLGRRD